MRFDEGGKRGRAVTHEEFSSKIGFGVFVVGLGCFGMLALALPAEYIVSSLAMPHAEIASQIMDGLAGVAIALFFWLYFRNRAVGPFEVPLMLLVAAFIGFAVHVFELWRLPLTRKELFDAPSLCIGSAFGFLVGTFRLWRSPTAQPVQNQRSEMSDDLDDMDLVAWVAVVIVCFLLFFFNREDIGERLGLSNVWTHLIDGVATFGVARLVWPRRAGCRRYRHGRARTAPPISKA